ncbi:MAG: hypothetical protein OWT28_08310 [Firmicutes bacterium]|nr:hypothetical protein [Bacillota bacterium]
MLQLARTAGLAVTAGMLAVLLGRVLQDLEWARLFCAMTMRREPVPRKVGRIWTWYGQAFVQSARILDQPLQRKRLVVTIIAIASLLFSVGRALHQNVLLAAVLSLVISLLSVRQAYKRRGIKRGETLLFAFFYEAVPVALHVLEASKQLDLAITRMADLVRDAPLKARLQTLAAMTARPQYETAEVAFLAWAQELGLTEIIFFALATKEAKRYGVLLPDLWVELRDLLGRDLEYRRSMRQRTAHYRQGGYIFYGMLAGTLLLTYPFTQAHMTSVTQALFWVVLSVMTLGLYGIVRESQAIDV